jgi:hypothetical protein
MGVSLSTVNRAHMAYDHGGLKALRRKPSGGRKRENMTLAEEKALLTRFAKAARDRTLHRSLLLLPSHSPELNPQENVWQFPRQRKLNNRALGGQATWSTPAAMPRTISPPTQTAAHHSLHALGHRSLANADGIICVLR